MANISAAAVKALRDQTGAPMGQCKQALVESDGIADKALEWLQKKSAATAEKKSGRSAVEGRVDAYIHHDGRTGVVMEVNCETDFAAGTDDFIQLVRDLCMQVAAMSPKYVASDEISAAELAHQREIFEAQARELGKPEAVLPRIVDGKVAAWYGDVCLLDQAFVKDEKGRKVRQILTERIAKIGENIVVRRFARFELGDGLEKKADDFADEVARMAGQA